MLIIDVFVLMYIFFFFFLKKLNGNSLVVQWLGLDTFTDTALGLIPSRGSRDCKEIQPVHPKGDQSWMFIGRTDVEAETPIFWPPDAKC